MRAPAQAVHLIAADLCARYGDVSHMWIARKIKTANFFEPSKRFFCRRHDRTNRASNGRKNRPLTSRGLQ